MRPLIETSVKYPILCGAHLCLFQRFWHDGQTQRWLARGGDHLSKAGVILSVGLFAVSVAVYPNLAFAG